MRNGVPKSESSTLPSAHTQRVSPDGSKTRYSDRYSRDAWVSIACFTSRAAATRSSGWMLSSHSMNDPVVVAGSRPCNSADSGDHVASPVTTSHRHVAAPAPLGARRKCSSLFRNAPSARFRPLMSRMTWERPRVLPKGFLISENVSATSRICPSLAIRVASQWEASASLPAVTSSVAMTMPPIFPFSSRHGRPSRLTHCRLPFARGKATASRCSTAPARHFLWTAFQCSGISGNRR